MTNNNNFPLFPSDCKSLLSKHLSNEVFEALKDKQTANNVSLKDIINSGLVNLDSGIGVYAGDSESYDLFAPLFDPIIEDYHGFKAADSHSSDLNPDNLNAPNPDPDGQYIVSTRIRVARNLADFPLGTSISKEQRKEIERKVSETLVSLSGELAGNYYPLAGMTKDIQEQLIADHFLFKEGDRFLEAAGLNRDWPNARGIYHNTDKTFLVWVNEEDQLRIISMQYGGDIKQTFTRLSSAISELEKTMSFAFSKHLGYIASCPSNLGTAMRASVHIKLPNLAKNMDVFKSITDKYHLQIRGIHGEHSETVDGVFDISNKRRLGVSEVQCVQDMYDGVIELIKTEKSL